MGKATGPFTQQWHSSASGKPAINNYSSKSNLIVELEPEVSDMHH